MIALGIARRAAALPPTPRHRGVACALAAVAGFGALALSGCGSNSHVAALNNGNQLTIYSSLPLSGPQAPVSQAIVNGEKLALAQAGGQVGPFTISYYSLNDARPVVANADPATETWSPEVTATDAKLAAQDKGTIAYLGDYDSGASAISLPLTNAAGILQISPASPYVGLTSAAYAGQDEPGRFYVTGRRTFGRLPPGDQVQGGALAVFMHRRGVHRVYVLSDGNPFEAALAQIVAANATRQGITVVGSSPLDSGANSFAGAVAKVQASGAEAVFFSGSPGPGTVRLWQQLYAADPHLLLLGSVSLDQASFTSQLGPSARTTYLATPLLARRLYPPLAQAFFRAYQQHFGAAAPLVSLYGYESMRDALGAIRAAGKHGNERAAVVKAFFALSNRDSGLGRYSVLPSGDTTLSDYAIDRVSDQGRPTFAEQIHVSRTSP